MGHPGPLLTVCCSLSTVFLLRCLVETTAREGACSTEPLVSISLFRYTPTVRNSFPSRLRRIALRRRLCGNGELVRDSVTGPKGLTGDHEDGGVAAALRVGIELVLAHEVPGIGGQEERGAVLFSTFFSYWYVQPTRGLRNRAERPV